MKAHYLLSAAVICMLQMFGSTANAQNVAINTTGNSPDASAMLDIQSSTKGLLIPQVSLTDLTDATTISSPAHSLLIYNTNAAVTGGKGYYYNSGTSGSPVWTKMVAAGTEWKLAGNTGTTPGTDFIGTTDAQALVLKTNGTSRMNVSSAGVTTIGNGTDQVNIAADGTITLEGAATVFDDLSVPVFSTSSGSSQPPTISKVKDNGSGSQGVFTFSFSPTTEQELYFTVQMPHAWKEGSNIMPHVHWTTATDLNGNKVRWGLEYTWVNVASVYGNTTIIYGEDPIAANGAVTAYEHAITDLGAITATGKTLSSILVCRIFRDATAGTDNYASGAFLLSIDFHYEKDAWGSRTEYGK